MIEQCATPSKSSKVTKNLFHSLNLQNIE